MNLDHLQAELRPRLPWEAADLGLALGLRHVGPLVRAWLAGAWPVWIAAALLLWVAPVWAWFPLWWLKPMMAVMPTFVLSRRLFGISPSWKQTFQALGSWMRHRALWVLTIGRFHRRRSVLQIVHILEGTRTPKERAHLFTQTTPGWLIKGCLIVELSLLIGLVTSFFWIGPASWLPWSEETGGFLAWYDSLSDDADSPGTRRLALIYTLAYGVASMASELIYLACSFGCYLNTRAEIEGWDIEIAFKRFARRAATVAARASGTTILLIAACGLLVAAPPSAAQEEPPSVPEPAAALETDSPEDRAARIVSDPEFTIHRKVKKRWRPPETTGDQSFEIEWLKPLAWIFAVLVIITIVGLLGWLVYRGAVLAAQAAAALPPGEGPRTVAGLDVRPESLPNDPLETARLWWAQGRNRAALGLLYRAALSWLIHHGGVPIEESDTEGDGLRRVAALPATTGLNSYFIQLTRAWLGIAYAGHVPTDATWEALCASWPFRGPPVRRPTAGLLRAPAGAGVLASLLLTLTGCGQFEKQEETIGYRGPARYNPFLAVSRLTESYDIGVRTSFSLLSELHSDNSAGSQWVVTPSILVNELTARRLLDSIASGGHALVAVSDIFPFEETGVEAPRWLKDNARSQENDPEYAREQWRENQLEDPTDSAEDDAHESARGTTGGERLRLRLAESSPGLATLMEEAGVRFADSVNEDAPTQHAGRSWGAPDWDWPAAFVPASAARSPKPARILSVDYGRGRITFLPSLRPFTNMRIAQEQHAGLWISLIFDEYGEAEDVCFIRGSGSSFLGVLWEHGWRALVAATLAVVLWLWSATHRFGLAPRTPVPAPSTATASLTATGAFLVRQRQAAALLAPWSDSILSRWRKKLPLDHEATLDAFLEGAAPAAGLSPVEARECFEPAERVTPRQFLALAQRLWRLERTL